MLILNGDCTQEDIDSLEFLITQVYEAIKKAVETKEFEFAEWAQDIYRSAQRYFNAAYINPQTRLAEERKSERGRILEKYILHHILMHDVSYTLFAIITHDKSFLKETDRDVNELLTAIKNKDTPYTEIWGIAQDLVHGGKFDAILNCLHYVRKFYPKPKIE